MHYTRRTARVDAVRARLVIGADGANSPVGRAEIPGRRRHKHVFAYHEIVRSPETGSGDVEATRCDVYYQGKLSPDFYAWVFPHGDTMSIGTGCAHKGFSLRRRDPRPARGDRPRRPARPCGARARRSR